MTQHPAVTPKMTSRPLSNIQGKISCTLHHLPGFKGNLTMHYLPDCKGNFTVWNGDSRNNNSTYIGKFLLYFRVNESDKQG